MLAIIGSEIAEVIWPIVKIGIPVAGVLVLVWAGVRSIKKSGASQATVEMQEEAEDARIDFEKDRARRRERALDRWRRLRDARATRLRDEAGTNGDVGP